MCFYCFLRACFLLFSLSISRESSLSTHSRMISANETLNVFAAFCIFSAFDGVKLISFCMLNLSLMDLLHI